MDASTLLGCNTGLYRAFTFVNLHASSAYLVFMCYLFMQVSGLNTTLVIKIINMSVTHFLRQPALLHSAPVSAR